MVTKPSRNDPGSLQQTKPTWVPTELISRPELNGELYLPSYSTKIREGYPAIIILPSCSGISNERERAYASYFNSKGMPCLIIDPFTRRGISECLSDPELVPINDLMQQASNAWSFLKKRAIADCIGVLGIGRGGLAVLHLSMQSIPGLPLSTSQFAFLIALSPLCTVQLRTPQPTGAPLLVITAENDEIADNRAVIRYTARIQAAQPEMTVTTICLKNAQHAWEVSGEPDFHEEAFIYPKEIYYLEKDGTYTDSASAHAYSQAEAQSRIRKSAKRGAHLGGGNYELFNQACRFCTSFIFRQHVAEHTNTDLGIINQIKVRDELLLAMSRCLGVEKLFSLVTNTFGNLPDTALVRIWLVEPPNGACERCFFIRECKDHTKCLQLVASAGYAIASEEEWSSTEGIFQRFPFGVHKVGVVAATGTPFHVPNVSPDMPWVASPEWIRREKIRTLLCQPLISEGSVIGVFVIFSRRNHDQSVLKGMRIIADHMAVKIAHARAYDELDRLKRQLEIENSYLSNNKENVYFLPGLIGESEAIRRVKEQILTVAPTDALVFITGESGTGKELVANELHAQSKVAKGPLVKVNCSTIPQELFESEFFGHIKGSFTGANSNHIGFFEAAQHGTLFLDEIGELPVAQQSKLLRALQESEYRRVGEQNTHKFQTRVVAATNRDPQKMVAEGNFREDLFYRLNVFPIHLPPLRERLEDIPLLADFFLRKFSLQLNRPGLHLRDSELKQLLIYSWPGNIRELQNVLHRAAILAKGSDVHLDFFDFREKTKTEDERQERAETKAGNVSTRMRHKEDVLRSTGEPVTDILSALPEDFVLDKEDMKNFERANLLRALKVCHGRIFGQKGAAALLKIKPTTLVTRLEKFGINKNDY